MQKCRDVEGVEIGRVEGVDNPVKTCPSTTPIMLCIESRREKWYHVGIRRKWNEAEKLHEKNSRGFRCIDGVIVVDGSITVR